MSKLDKYLIVEKKEESLTYKSLMDRIKKAKKKSDLNKVLQDVKKAINTKEISSKEAIKLADMADSRLEEM